MEMWLEYESSVQALRSWMTTQEERLKRKHRIEDLTSVQNALRDCQVGFSYGLPKYRVPPRVINTF